MGKYVGKWVETRAPSIDLPLTAESLRTLLSFGASAASPFTHQQIAHWAYRFWWECEEGSLVETEDPTLELAADVAFDVNAQWNLFLSNTYRLDELQALDFSAVELPRAWFDEWQRRLD